MPTFGSLFSGAGLMDLGFEQAGWECVWAVEWDKAAVNTWRKNRPGQERKIICADIRHVDEKWLKPVDLIIGGPPCQGFSTQNNSRVFGDNNVSEWRNDKRNLLYKEYVRIVGKVRPKEFIMENVKPMYTTGATDDGPGPIARAVMDDFANLGYTVGCDVLNAVNYGVPQKRERLIVHGVLGDHKSVLFPLKTHGPGLLPVVTVQDVLGDRPQLGSLPNHSDHAPLGTLRYQSSNRPLSWDKPSQTIVAHYNSGVPILGDRRLTPRECARLQTVPDDYVYYGSLSATYRQNGNGVPVELARRIAAVLIGSERGRMIAPYRKQLSLF